MTESEDRRCGPRRAATRASASSGPPIAPRLSIARSNPYARPYAAGGHDVGQERVARGDAQPARRPRAARGGRRPATRRSATPISAEKTAVAV